ncbi:glycerophosphodiester phosphodiesterase [Clostridium lundense]|uniref:glycerophosphodiester phosphodiesterase n=1 Tax=Clostridium lundense TaxID=319475 RepID=UPI00068431EF|nr:glycerophosphodiester phosphodiesterase [Clostridium lundense]
MVLSKKNCFIYSFKKSLINFVPFIIFIALIFMPSTVLFSFPMDNDKIFITAHRGNSSKAPENTLSAIKYAINSEVDYAEIDVQETKDGKIILFHDNNFKRVCGHNKKIWEVTYHDLENYDAGSYFNSKFRGEKIPTLDEILRASNGKIKLNIEIKTNGHDKNLVLNSLNMIKNEKFKNNCIITSSNYNVLKQIRKLDPSIKIGYITHNSLKDLESMDVDIYSLDGRIVNRSFIEKAHKKGRQVHVWTINKEKDMVKYINLGVDNIITDYPDKLKSIIAKRKNQTLLSAMRDEI